MSALLAGSHDGQLPRGKVHNLTFNDKRLTTFDCMEGMKGVSTPWLRNKRERGGGEREGEGERTHFHPQ